MENAKKCMIIAASPINSSKVFEEFNPNDYFVVCADGGYETAMKFGIKPDFIVGDFDSAKVVPSKAMHKIRVLPEEKDFTDTMYAALAAYELGYKSFVMLGCSGGDREDHTIANYNVMMYLMRKGCSAVMVDDNSKRFILGKSRLKLNEQKGSLVSVFPFGSLDCMLTYKGLKYDLKNCILKAGDTLMGVSNEIIDDEAEITVHNGFALVILLNKNIKR